MEVGYSIRRALVPFYSLFFSLDFLKVYQSVTSYQFPIHVYQQLLESEM